MLTKCPVTFLALALALLLPVTALAASGPSINTQPLSTNVLAGSNAVFTVNAGGSLPLSYQWSFDTVNLTNSSHIKGATTATLTVSNITTADNGNYQVLVSNMHGSIASSNATLTVLFPPAISSEPASQFILLSNSVVFAATATGTLPLSYQWYFNGAPLTDGANITGSTTPNLSLSNLQISQGGNYQLIVTNNYGSATSMIATLTILVPAAISLQPTNQTILLSSNVTFAASATGTLPLSYQWYFNGAPLTDGSGFTGSATASLNLSDVQTSEAGSYQLVATNLYGSATTAIASLTVLVPAAITVQPTNFVSSIGASASFSVTATGTGSLTYQWQENGTNLTDGGQITGSATSTLTISNILMSNVGNYSVMVSNSYGVASSTPASLMVVPILMWGGQAGSGGGIFTPAMTNTIAMAWGDFDFGVALNNYGTVSAWGNSEYSQLEVPAGLSNVVAVCAGTDVALALMANGTVAGWGNNGNAQTPPAGLTNVVQVSVGDGYCLALLNNGTITTWGSPATDYGQPFGQTNIPAGLSNVVAVAAGLYHALALKNDGTIVGWGYNAYGQATPPAGATNIVAIGAGSVHSVALKSDGTVIAWGYDGSGQTNVPAGLSNVVAIAVGAWHNVALKRDGTVVAWGSDDSGESDVPAGLSNVVEVGANDDAGVALVQNPTASVPPAIWWQGPTNNIILTSATTILNPYVIGSLPMSFQWYFNGTPLTGQSNQWLVLNPLQINQAGNYSLIVSNNYGSVTNTVSIIPAPPAILTQPANQNVFPSANASFTVVAAPGPLNYQWYFNGTPLTDGGNVSGSATATLSIQNVQNANYGNYQVIVTNAWGSITSSVAGLTQAQIHYVNVNNKVPVAPYKSWATAATNIQPAIAVAIAGDEVLVTNGFYNYGDYTPPGSGNAADQVALLQPISVISVNGPGVTEISASLNYPDNGRRAAYVTNGALLAGFTLTGGAVDFQSTGDPIGGGVECASASAVVSNCVIIGNFARVYGGGAYGGTFVNCVIANNTGVSPFISEVGDAGGAYAANLLDCIITNNVSHRGGGVESCALTNCLVVNNAVSDYGGGAYDSVLVNCTVVGNTVNTNGDGGGMFGGTAENSIIVSNTATAGGLDNYVGSTFTYCCTVPNPGGTGNIAADPSLINFSGGNYRLQSTSPCIDTGNNSFIAMATDIDGNPRIVNGVVDMGAYEYQHAPWFLYSPTNQTIVAGSNIVLTATILGDPSVYQWYYNGVPLTDGGRILGSTSNTLTIAMSVTSDFGNYWITASNGSGVVTSAVAVVTVQLPVNIISQPTNQIVLLGSNATFTVTAIGFVPPNYLWYSNGIAMANGGRISGTTSNTLTISSTQPGDVAAYQVVVTNIYGSATSSVATLTVIMPVQIIGQPASQDALLGTNITFTVAAGGSGPFTYIWYFNGTPLSDGGRISGSATATLNIANVQSTDAGAYRVVVGNSYSSATSLTASLTPQAALGPSVRYVMLTSTNPQSPYLNWSTAATNIQDAVDAAVAGDSVVVSNGTYNVGGRLVYGTNAPNRVVINKPITVQSLNGPAATTIIGFDTFAGAYFPGRCVYLTNGAFLSGFTLTKGGAGTASTSDLVHEKSGGGAWCESGAVISNCVLFANTASLGYGGGAFGGTLYNCLLATNTGDLGGGGASNILLNCVLQKNTAAEGPGNVSGQGGGAFDSISSNCVFAANSGSDGGGAYGGVLFDCILTNNSASEGGGAYSGVLYNCILAYNIGRGFGGGAYNSTLYNCTVVTNTSEGVNGGGIWGGAATNCIIYYNTVGGDVENSKNNAIAYCCASGIGTLPGCITNPPLFVNFTNSDFHLQSNSPCINSGENAAVTVSNDIAGDPRIVGGTVDMGAYEYQSPASIISYAWLEQYGLPTDGSVDFANLDGTGFNVYQDYIAGLNPTNAASVLQANIGITSLGTEIEWSSVGTRNYFVQRSTNLLTQPFTNIGFIYGQPGNIDYFDTTATNGGPYYYRIGVLLP